MSTNRSTSLCLTFFFFNASAPTEIYTLSLHDALPIFDRRATRIAAARLERIEQLAQVLVHNVAPHQPCPMVDRKSTRLNSSHTVISYAVFCLKKKSHPAGLCPGNTARDHNDSTGDRSS